LTRLLADNFDLTEVPTVAANWQLWRCTLGGREVELQLWDTAGQEKFRAIAPLYYRNSAAAVLLYDITNFPSFENLPSWVSAYVSVVPGGHVIIVGNKSDLDEARVVSHEAGLRWAKAEGCLHYETSAKTGENVNALFAAVAEVIALEKSELPDITGQVPAERSDMPACC
jgi:small GTP-binding protein